MNWQYPELKELESTASVRFQDCDPYGHLNNARYVDYFMNARQDQLLQFYHFDIFGVGRELNKGWVVTKSQLSYLLPAFMQEKVLIRTRLIRVTDKTLLVEGLMLDQEVKHLKAVVWIEFAFVDLGNGRTAKHPDEMMQFLTLAVYDAEDIDNSFDQRVLELKAYFRRYHHAGSLLQPA